VVGEKEQLEIERFIFVTDTTIKSSDLIRYDFRKYQITGEMPSESEERRDVRD
jgi:hypothetical protein